MWNTLKILLAPIWPGIQVLIWIYEVTVKLLPLILAIGGLVMTIGGMLWAFVDVAGGLDGITTAINNTAANIRAMPIAPAMHAINRILPLNEFLVMQGLLLGVYLACILIRWISSFLPGLRG